MNQENPQKPPQKAKKNAPAIYVLIAAAGSGTRLQNSPNDPPKQYRPLCGIPVITRSVLAFMDMEEITSIRCIINPEHANWYHDALGGVKITPPAAGGLERKNSVYNALKEIPNVEDEDIILVHDAARPLIQKHDILALLDALKTHRAATLATPVCGTLRKVENDLCGPLLDRENLYELQTPQGFRYADLLKAHEDADPKATHTDDTSLVSAGGIPVKLVQSQNPNFKITHAQDFTMAEKLLSSEYSDIRTGTGFDVHAFDTASRGPVRLCGIDVPHTHKLKGHSDADVGLHAITDALLGAIAQGDIGQHFPPSDNAYKNMDSAVFLQKACDMLTAQNGLINNIDLTLICEEPKIGPHTAVMQARIAEITRIQRARINVKATTTEQLGFTGRKEGIAAQASVTVRLK